MNLGDIARLIALAAIWGGSFIFMRILAPVLGPIATAESRVLIAGVLLVGFFSALRVNLEWRRFWKQYAVVGLLNSGIPFMLLAFAALHIPAGYSATVNASSPLFGAIFSAIWLKERLTALKLIGLVVGALGVALVAGIGSLRAGPSFLLGVGAVLLGSTCYGLAGVFIKLKASEAKPVGMAAWSQLSVGALLLPLAILAPPVKPVTAEVMWLAILFAVLCNAVAYLLYFRLMQDVGPTRALTVTFLVPVFAVVWALVLLREPVTWSMVGGGALVFAGTGMIFYARVPAPQR